MEGLKSGRFLPLDEDLNKFSHNHASYAARGALIVGACFASAGAKDAHTSFTVGATVRAVASIKLDSMPGVLHISARDVARGYSEIVEPAQLSISSNSQHGYALEFLTVAPIFSQVIVQGLGSDVDLGADGGTVVQRGPAARPVRLALKFRFMLARGIVPGDYPWPMRFAVRPLEST
jgi:hypothetical protein